MELLPRLREMKNFWDRISLKYVLNPLDEEETNQMIEFRLRAAGYNTGVEFFTGEAITEIYRYTQGYPRRIAMLCHNALKALVMENKPVVDALLIRNLIAGELKINA
jgi:general secretion pathway protein A